ncbi:AlkA N-terminal domain-containing protein [Shewanella sp. Isolate11]|uniref:DNA-3-methyladenine glycosylase 2 family protein n=1 Tax=Shewanella sp. Isolate11 TaxID=2908530 RepID=UPI001EFD4E7D|nr:AlkA N-terminal domain-containing protein [Shewanella sp. Isolate11]MCG9698330.1 helix-turn-helix domain-containing protein [Shewanella sp. Isolate11]
MTQDQIDTAEHFRLARLSRDRRFDGLFYVGVFSTGIYCRPICPAVPAKEENVGYFDSALAAANQGLRPCLRCRPDSAPQSNPWIGTQTSVNRALALINSGVLSGPNAISLEDLAQRLGMTSRYLRALFRQYIGASPKQYALYQQLLFAKQLLHQTQIPITHVAFASGFNSVRRFNEVFQQQLQMTPSAIRNSGAKECDAETNSLALTLHYRPPFNWQHMREFYRLRAVEGMEWISDDCYGRSFQLHQAKGYFIATHQPQSACFKVNIVLNDKADLAHLNAIVAQIRRMLDLDADMSAIQARLTEIDCDLPNLDSGIRIPGIWSTFEAGCRAVLGQQVSVTQAVKLLAQLVEHYGQQQIIDGRRVYFFPNPESIATATLDCLKMPGARKQALRDLAQFVVDNPQAPVEQWLSIKGIGSWTIDYVRMRGLSLPDILLAGDLVVKNQLLDNLPFVEQVKEAGSTQIKTEAASLDTEVFDAKALKRIQLKQYLIYSQQLAHQVSPWGSYLTFQLWSKQ